MSDGTIELRYPWDKDLTVRMAQRASFALLERSGDGLALRVVRPLLWAAVPFVALFGASLAFTGWEGALAVVIAGGLGVYAAHLLAMESHAMLQEHGHKAGLGDALVQETLDDAGVTETAGPFRSVCHWRGVSGMLEAPDGVGLMVGATVIVLPDLALPVGLDRAGLKARIDDWRRAAA